MLKFKTKKEAEVPLLFLKTKEQGFILPLFLLGSSCFFCVTRYHGHR